LVAAAVVAGILGGRAHPSDAWIDRAGGYEDVARAGFALVIFFVVLVVEALVLLVWTRGFPHKIGAAGASMEWGQSSPENLVALLKEQSALIEDGLILTAQMAADDHRAREAVTGSGASRFARGLFAPRARGAGKYTQLNGQQEFSWSRAPGWPSDVTDAPVVGGQVAGVAVEWRQVAWL
jgi:hypothetical protein